MSEKEKNMIEKIAKLPPELQNRLCDKIDGAVMALDTLKAAESGATDKTDAEDKI